MKYLYKIGLMLSIVMTAGACSGQLDTIQEYLDDIWHLPKVKDDVQ